MIYTTDIEIFKLSCNTLTLKKLINRVIISYECDFIVQDMLVWLSHGLNERDHHFDTFTLKISSVILLTVCNKILIEFSLLVWLILH